MEALRQDRSCREPRKIAVPSKVSPQLRIWSRLKAVAMLWLMLAISMPISLIGMLIALCHHRFWRQIRGNRERPRGPLGTALVSGKQLLSIPAASCFEGSHGSCHCGY
jgi:hypothetical protein